MPSSWHATTCTGHVPGQGPALRREWALAGLGTDDEDPDEQRRRSESVIRPLPSARLGADGPIIIWRRFFWRFAQARVIAFRPDPSSYGRRTEGWRRDLAPRRFPEGRFGRCKLEQQLVQVLVPVQVPVQVLVLLLVGSTSTSISPHNPRLLVRQTKEGGAPSGAQDVLAAHGTALRAGVFLFRGASAPLHRCLCFCICMQVSRTTSIAMWPSRATQ